MVLNPIDNPNEDTEFNDILRKHGILPERQVTPPPPSPPPAPSLSETLQDRSAKELEELEEDAHDSDEERIVAAYRRQRLAEMRKVEKTWKFGEILPIGRDDYSREVTEASKIDEPDSEKGTGTGVVVFLYKDGDPPCVQLRSQLELMAKRYPRTKFVSIVGNKCIENYPDRLQPTLILYRAGEVAAQVVSWGKDRAREPQELEALLVVSKAVSMEHRVNDVDSRPPTKDPDFSDDELGPDTRSKAQLSGKPSEKSSKIRSTAKVEDDDSDFDL